MTLAGICPEFQTKRGLVERITDGAYTGTRVCIEGTTLIVDVTIVFSWEFMFIAVLRKNHRDLQHITTAARHALKSIDLGQYEYLPVRGVVSSYLHNNLNLDALDLPLVLTYMYDPDIIVNSQLAVCRRALASLLSTGINVTASPGSPVDIGYSELRSAVSMLGSVGALTGDELLGYYRVSSDTVCKVSDIVHDEELTQDVVAFAAFAAYRMYETRRCINPHKMLDIAKYLAKAVTEHVRKPWVSDESHMKLYGRVVGSYLAGNQAAVLCNDAKHIIDSDVLLADNMNRYIEAVYKNIAYLLDPMKIGIKCLHVLYNNHNVVECPIDVDQMVWGAWCEAYGAPSPLTVPY